MKLVIHALICVSIFGIACKKIQLYGKESRLLAVNMVNDAPLDGYVLSWSDEFNAPALDTTNWKYRVGVSQKSYQRAANVRLDSGKLVIDLKTENFGGKSLTGGGIITKTASGYGYYEVSARLDGGYGWHEAFWTTGMSGFDDPNPIKAANARMLEIDCFEHYGEYDAYHLTYGAIEWGPYPGNVNRGYHTSTPDLSAGYHTYGFEYTPDYLNYYFDGLLLKTVDMRGVPQHNFYMWLSAIATKADATSSGHVYFDYVRAYTISPSEYNTRKTTFINALDAQRGPMASGGTDLWIEAEDFVQKSNWTTERDVQNSLIIKGFTSYSAGRDSTQLRARTGITVATAGTYKLWVRSRDFTTAPGTRKFKVIVNGITSPTEYGTHGTDGYAWQSGGTFTLAAGQNILDIFDSSQYHARCDKILLTTDLTFIPSLIGGVSNVLHNNDL
ncbi:glycoside hydrolase family 16 protein [Pedobacter africanus]|uniref:Beta-glucanase (GH16 family) n=1 Tax=Pedobacter africanus TaxID=151894 RepID=A0ACC6KRS9_9SPHI|nr:glycoside hydrolase family 16 protein [Pedobacter africanus]MDR6781969.1 beta-glucanase (GH16 family) [Pedobacter africanus]